MSQSPPVQEPQPIGWSRAEVQQFGSNAAKSLGYTPGSDMEVIVKKLGGDVTVSDWESARNTGSITVKGPKKFTISLSPLSGERRSRFTIAHEIGHYMLHSQLGKIPISVRRDGSGRVEWEANWFAAGFLMPEEEFKARQSEGYGEAELAEYFGVSVAAVQVRQSTL